MRLSDEEINEINLVVDTISIAGVHDEMTVIYKQRIRRLLADRAELKAENEALREVVEGARKRQWLCELRPDNEAEARNQASMIILANQALSAALAKLDALEAKKEKQS